MTKMMSAVTWNLDVVADQTLRLLKARTAPSENVVGSDGKFLFVVLRIIPAWVFDFVSSLLPIFLKPEVLKSKK